MNQLGKRVRDLRIKSGMSEVELARKAGYKSDAIIKAIEAGSRTPSFEKNLDIARALGVSVNELLGNKKGLSANEKKVLGGISEYINELPEEDITLGVKVFRLIYDAYLGRKAKDELNKITDKLSLESHKEKYPYKGPISQDDEEDEILNVDSALKKIADERTCRLTIEVKKKTYMTEIYIGDKILKKEEGEVWDDNPARLAVTLIDNILKNHPEVLSCQSIDVYTNNEYLRKGINTWAKNWKKNKWEKSGGGKIAFRGFWERIVNIQGERRLKAYAK